MEPNPTTSSVSRSISGKPCALANRSSPRQLEAVPRTPASPTAPRPRDARCCAARPPSRRHGRPVHDGRVELDDSVFIGQAAIADRMIVGIGLDDRHPLDRGVEWIVARFIASSLFNSRQAIAAGHDHRSRRRPACPRGPDRQGAQTRRGRRAHESTRLIVVLMKTRPLGERFVLPVGPSRVSSLVRPACGGVKNLLPRIRGRMAMARCDPLSFSSRIRLCGVVDAERHLTSAGAAGSGRGGRRSGAGPGHTARWLPGAPCTLPGRPAARDSAVSSSSTVTTRCEDDRPRCRRHRRPGARCNR